MDSCNDTVLWWHWWEYKKLAHCTHDSRFLDFRWMDPFKRHCVAKVGEGHRETRGNVRGGGEEEKLRPRWWGQKFNPNQAVLIYIDLFAAYSKKSYCFYWFVMKVSNKVQRKSHILLGLYKKIMQRFFNILFLILPDQSREKSPHFLNHRNRFFKLFFLLFDILYRNSEKAASLKVSFVALIEKLPIFLHKLRKIPQLW